MRARAHGSRRKSTCSLAHHRQSGADGDARNQGNGRVLPLSPDGSALSSRLRGTGDDGTTTTLTGRETSAEPDGNADTVRQGASDDVSATGSQFQDTPLIVPTRENLDLVKRLMVGDTYIGRGSRQRNLPKSQFCIIYKVSQYGRTAAIEHFQQEDNANLQRLIWTLSGCRLLCHYCGVYNRLNLYSNIPSRMSWNVALDFRENIVRYRLHQESLVR